MRSTVREAFEIAERFGFVEANEPGTDALIVAYRNEAGSHSVFVEAPHEILRGTANAAILEGWRRSLSQARDLADNAVPGVTSRPAAGVTVRPIDALQLELQSGDQLVNLSRPDAQALHAPDDWPVWEGGSDAAGG